MSWEAILQIMIETVGEADARRIDQAIRAELRGMRITIPSRISVTAEQADAIAPGQPRKAAELLGVHPSSVYRAMQRRRIVR